MLIANDLFRQPTAGSLHQVCWTHPGESMLLRPKVPQRSICFRAWEMRICPAAAPIDASINERQPDVARRIHVRVALVLHIINQVATIDDEVQ